MRLLMLTNVVAVAFSMGAIAPIEVIAQQLSQNTVAGPDTTNSPASRSDCTYETCALRMKLKRGNWHIVRGGADMEVTKIGVFSTPNITSLVSTSPAALEMAREFQAKHSSGNRLLLVGTIAYAAGMLSFGSSTPPALSFIVSLAGIRTFLAGDRYLDEGMNALTKSLWIYNGSVPR